MTNWLTNILVRRYCYFLYLLGALAILSTNYISAYLVLVIWAGVILLLNILYEEWKHKIARKGCQLCKIQSLGLKRVEEEEHGSDV